MFFSQNLKWLKQFDFEKQGNTSYFFVEKPQDIDKLIFHPVNLTSTRIIALVNISQLVQNVSCYITTKYLG